MTQSALVTQDDVETALVRPLTSSEQNFITPLCNTASVQLRALLPSVDARIADYNTDPSTPDAINPALVSSVLGTVIAQAFRNPEGLTSLAKTTGPYSVQKSYGATDSNPVGVNVTVADVARIVPTSNYVSPRTIRLAKPHCHGRRW